MKTINMEWYYLDPDYRLKEPSYAALCPLYAPYDGNCVAGSL